MVIYLTTAIKGNSPMSSAPQKMALRTIDGTGDTNYGFGDTFGGS